MPRRRPPARSMKEANWDTPSSLDVAVGNLVGELKDRLSRGTSEDVLKDLADDPATAQLSIAVGEFSIWLQQKRNVLASLR